MYADNVLFKYMECICTRYAVVLSVSSSGSQPPQHLVQHPVDASVLSTCQPRTLLAAHQRTMYELLPPN
jgi:hypothetical protein